MANNEKRLRDESIVDMVNNDIKTVNGIRPDPQGNLNLGNLGGALIVNSKTYDPDPDTGTIDIGKVASAIMVNGTECIPALQTGQVVLPDQVKLGYTGQVLNITWSTLAATQGNGIFGDFIKGDIQLNIGGDIHETNYDYTLNLDLVATGTVLVKANLTGSNNDVRSLTIDNVNCGRLNIDGFRLKRLNIEKDVSSSLSILNNIYLLNPIDNYTSSVFISNSGTYYIGNMTYEDQTKHPNPIFELYNCRVFYAGTMLTNIGTQPIVAVRQAAAFYSSLNMQFAYNSIATDGSGTVVIYKHQLQPVYDYDPDKKQKE